MSLLFAKRAAPSYAMAGRLYKSNHGDILLSVPNALVRGVFDTLNEPGVELPPSGPDEDQLNAHISVMRPEEVNADDVTERGHSFHYTLGPLKSFNPTGWKEMSKCWVIECKSPELEKLRKSYGLSKLPNNNKFKFHITVGVRRTNVLGPNDTAKSAAVIESLLPGLS
jgi:hypothetical protein